MEILRTIISFFLLFCLISIPILLFVGIKKWYRLRFAFISYLIIGLTLTVGIMWIFAWWTDYSRELLMNNYGYNFDSMNDSERFQNVETVNIEKVKQLEIGHYGIGWPLKAIMLFPFYSPYLLVVYLIGQLIIRIKEKNKVHVSPWSLEHRPK